MNAIAESESIEDRIREFLSKNKVSIKNLALGHSKIEQTMVYVRLHPEEMFTEFMDKFDSKEKL